MEGVGDQKGGLASVAAFAYWRTMSVTLRLMGFCGALIPLLTYAIMGNGRHVRIDMTEVQIPRMAASLGYCISGHVPGVDCGQKRAVQLDTLVAYAFPDEVSMATIASGNREFAKAPYELAELGWSISEHAKGAVYHRSACTITITVTNYHEKWSQSSR